MTTRSEALARSLQHSWEKAHATRSFERWLNITMTLEAYRNAIIYLTPSEDYTSEEYLETMDDLLILFIIASRYRSLV